MLSGKKKIEILAAFATLILSAVGLGCHGFFVDPVLTSITVGPTATIQTAETIQMSATGTYNDGSTSSLTSGVSWSTGTPSAATVTKAGLVTGVGQGSSIITAASGTQTGTATITVTIGGITAIKVTTSDGKTSIPFGSTEQFVATATANGKPVDVTNSVTWTTSPATITGVSIDPSSGFLTTTSGAGGTAQSFQVIATDPTTNITGVLTFSVTGT
jgi:hypothetical protein